MEIQELINKWSLLPSEASGSLKSLRIDSLSKPDLFIGLDTKQRRSLILKLPITYIPDFQSSVKQNLSLELYPKTRWIVLTLLDEQYFDLFNDLIFSIYNKIKDIIEPVPYVSELLKTYYKWSEFFIENSEDGLSDDQVKGLFGELIILSELLKKTNSSNLNDVLNSWKGLYDTGHDFIGENTNIEVKTKSHTAANIKISSEYQLQAEAGKCLELVLVNVKSEPLEGLSLKDVVLMIRNYIMQRLGDYTILLRALSQKGLTLKNIEVYNHVKFIPISIFCYDCDKLEFPKIIKSSLPESINSVSYKLNVDLLKSFIISKITL